MTRTIYIMVASLLLASGIFADAGGSWLQKVPTRDHQRVNPLSGQADAVAAGRLLFQDHCAACHGTNAEGRKKKPSLHTLRVQMASDGDLHWLLVNGSMWKGMPSWSKLPDPQLWQLVSYLKSLSN